jgi:glycopeptide antibiotics resistance protein
VVGLSSRASRPTLEPVVGRREPWIARYGWALWGAIVLVASVVPVEWVFGFADSEDWSWMAGLGHFAEFGVFAALVALAWSRRHGWPEALLLGAAAGMGYGLLIEAVQFPLPYRSADLRDLALDVCGVLTAALLLNWARRGRERRRGHRG